ncbi:MAG TPA: T9SS type A sorting domain-containing protein, partial [Candidatus Kapabacteria bacterium]|nr:T9SS type A sorting domain-containing protein [Candidatus Kapabacteria bacterium]
VPFTLLPICGLSGVLYVTPSAMAQNYPNPFTERTTIPVTLSQRELGAAQLKVYNIFGKQVADLSAQANSGSSAIELDGSALPTGVYACVLQTPSTKITRQLFVVH